MATVASRVTQAFVRLRNHTTSGKDQVNLKFQSDGPKWAVQRELV